MAEAKTWLCGDHQHLEPLPLETVKSHLASCDDCRDNVAAWEREAKLRTWIATAKSNLRASEWAVAEHQADVKSYSKHLKQYKKELREFLKERQNG